MEIYIDDAVYDRLVTALLTVELSPFNGEPDEDGIKIKLGEIGGIWPMVITPPRRNRGPKK